MARKTIDALPFLIALLLVLGGIFAIALLVGGTLGSIIMLVALLIEWVAIEASARNHADRHLVATLADFVRDLETHPEAWKEYRSRRRLNRTLERAAVHAENLGRNLRPGDPATERELDIRGYGVAAAIRQLKLSVSMPQSGTFGALISRCVGDIETLVRGEWYNLPVVESKRVRVKVRRVVASLCLAGGAILLAVIVHARLPGNAPVIWVLVAIALGALAPIGISPKQLAELLDVAKKVTPPKD